MKSEWIRFAEHLEAEGFSKVGLSLEAIEAGNAELGAYLIAASNTLLTIAKLARLTVETNDV